MQKINLLLIFLISIALFGQTKTNDVNTLLKQKIAPIPFPKWKSPIKIFGSEHFIVKYDPKTQKKTILKKNGYNSDFNAEIIEGQKITNGLNETSPPNQITNFSDLTKVIDPTIYPWNMTVKIYVKFSNGFTGQGSGILIDSKTVLTAGHNLSSEENGNAYSIIIIPAYENGNFPFGYAYNLSWYTWQDWDENRNFDWDMGVIELDRPIGALTGWAGYGYNNTDDYFSNNIFTNPGYPSTEQYNGEYMYTWGGKFDDADENILFINKKCIEGQSGSGVYDNQNVVYSVLINYRDVWGLPTITRFCRINSEKYNKINNLIGLYTPMANDLIPLKVRVDPQLINAGNSFNEMNYILHNYSGADWEGTIYVDIYLSPDDQITTEDRKLLIHKFSGAIQSKHSYTVNLNNIKPQIPNDIKSGNYYIGIILSTSDANNNNNSTNGWDCIPITVTASEILSPPSNVQASDGTYTDKIRITWNSASGADTYRLYRNTENNSSTITKHQVGITNTYFDDDINIEQGKTYYYWVKTQNSLGDISDLSSSDAGFAKEGNRPPTPPQLVSPDDSFVLNTPGIITFSWNNSTDPDGNNITYYFALSEDGIHFEDENEGSLTSFTINNISSESNGKYLWYIYAKDNYGFESQKSEIRSFSINIPVINEAELSVSSLSFYPQIINAGASPTSVSFRLTNNGAESLISPNTSIEANYYISKNSTFGDNDDIKIGNKIYDLNLSSGTYKDLPLYTEDLPNLKIPEDAKDNYYVFVKVNHTSPSTLIDPSLGNNFTVRSGTILVKGPTLDLIADNVSRNFGNVQLSNNPSPNSYSFTVKNSGGSILSGNIIENANWIALSSTSFSLTTNQTKTITVTANTSGLTLGSYTEPIKVASNSGDVTGNVSVTIYQNHKAPTIIQQPTNKTVNEGETATFSVTAACADPIGYQWWRFPFISEAESKIENNSGKIEGAQTSQLKLLNTTSADNNTSFLCEVYNTVDHTNLWVNSNSATLSVIQLPNLAISSGSVAHDFGNVQEGNNPSPNTYSFTVKNTGEGTLTGNVVENASWLSISSTSFSLTANQTKTFTVTATTASISPNNYSETISVTSNGGNTSGNVLVNITQGPALTISFGNVAHDFGNVQEGNNPSTNTYNFIIKNIGDGTLTGNIVENAAWLNLNSTSFSLTANQTKTFTVTATTSSLAPNNYSETINITSNGGNTSGNVLVNITQDPVLNISSGNVAHDFGSVQEGNNPSPNTYSFIIKNYGGGTLTGNVVENASWLSLNSTSFSLTANQTKTFTVTATTASLSPNNYSETISVTSNGGNTSGNVLVNIIPKISNSIQISVAKIDENNDYIPDRIGETVTITGIVLNKIFNLSNMTVFVQDETGGIQLYSQGNPGTNFNTGDLITATGKIDQYGGLAELIITDSATGIEIISSNNIITPILLSIDEYLSNAEKYEGTLIKINGLAITANSNTWPVSGSDANLNLWNGYGNELKIRVDKDTDADENSEPLWPIDLIGIASQFDQSTPPSGGYQVLLRSYSDITQNVSVSPIPYFSLLNPSNSTTIQIIDTNDTVDFQWMEAEDLNNDLEKYIFQFIPGYLFAETHIPNFKLSAKNILFLMNGNMQSTYDWTVTAFDANSQSSSSIDTFTVIFENNIPTSIKNNLLHDNEIPMQYYLANNYPNPFNPSTNISFGLPEQSIISLVVYDISGKVVETFLHNELLSAGSYNYSFEAKNLVSGIYFYTLKTDKFVQTKKLLLIK
ncbi:MAG: T9SS type A sorting domain-containing protein [Ignavibacteriae bacterium]|nr:T9SS type A sorting domain-containing protein [Ignavibacteriota bacterium]